jgi:hypothetical protein
MQFIKQEHLLHLNLSNNFIATLHSKDTFTGLVSVQSLDLSNNIITSLRTNTFNRLDSLIELHLKLNKISAIYVGAFNGLNHLEVLHLEGNLLQTIRESWLQPVNSLRCLYLSNNRLRKLKDGAFKSLTGLRILNLRNNQIQVIQDLAFEGLIGQNLYTLDLSYNNISAIPSSALSYLSKLTSLDISGNSIKILPASSFVQLRWIRTLYLSNMHELKLVERNTFSKNGRLSKLYLDNNFDLMPLPYGIFDANPLLKTLSIQNNTKWETLTQHQIPILSIRQLFVSGIIFNCNCSVMWLWEIYQTKNETGIEIDEAKCKEQSNPTEHHDVQSGYRNDKDKDENMLSQKSREQLTCTKLRYSAAICAFSPQTTAVVISLSFLIMVWLFLIVALIVKLRYNMYNRLSTSGYGSSCVHLKADSTIFKDCSMNAGKADSKPSITSPHLL